MCCGDRLSRQSLADLCAAKRHVRSTPNNDRKSGFPQTAMSASPPCVDGSELARTFCAMQHWSVRPCVRRTRHLFIRQQTAVINAIRAHLAEFGIVAPVGRRGVEQLLEVVTRQLRCSGVLVATNRMLALVTASQIATASTTSFFCRLT